jgi:hypothetical protein
MNTYVEQPICQMHDGHVHFEKAGVWGLLLGISEQVRVRG